MSLGREAPVCSPKILLVEDHPINQRVALSQLGKLGYCGDLAASGRAALEALARACYDAVLMDCQMPEMDGYEATVRIRSREGGRRHTIIIALTSHAMAGNRQKCLAAGMDDYLAKPVTVGQLGLMLERWLAVARSYPSGAAIRDETARLDASTIGELRGLGAAMFSELVGLFLEDASATMAVLLRDSASGDAKAVAKLAHGLKGASGAIGANRMHALCAAIQQAAASGQSESAGALAELETEFAQVRALLEPEQARPLAGRVRAGS